MPKRLNYLVSFTADTGSLLVAVDKAVQSLLKLGTSSQFQLTSQLKEASSAALDLSTHLTLAFNQDTGQLDLITFNNLLKLSGLSLSQYADKLVSIGPAGEAAFMNVALAITKAELPLRRSNALLDSLWVTMKNTMRWQLTSSVLHGFMGGILTAYGYTKDLNESLNSILIVTGKSSEEMARFADLANKAAKALSTTTTLYTDASLIYYQQGLPDEQVEARTNTTIKLANVARESALEASEQLTAIWNNFAKGGENLEYYVDVMAALGATTASSTQEISDGVQKFAAVADTVGLSYEYAASALATITATTRESADVVGTALRTLFARIQGLMLDGEADDGTTLNKYSKALAEVGILIKDTEGNLKDMDTILNEMGNTWGTLTQAQLMALAQTVAGVRQYTLLIALMNNWQFFQENLTTAMNSEGTLEEQAQIYAESWEAARDRVRAASEDIYDSLINDDFYIGLDNAFTPILNRIADVIDGLGGMRGVLSVVGLAMNKVYGERIAQSLRDFATNINVIRGVESQRARDLQALAAELTEHLTITYSANQAELVRLDLMKLEVVLLGTINLAMSSLDGSQKAWLETELLKIALMEKEVMASAEVAHNYAANAQQSRDVITTSVDVKKGWQKELQAKLNKGFGKEDFVVELKPLIKAGNVDSVVNGLLNELGKLAQESAQVEQLSLAFNRFGEITDENRAEITELYAAIKGIDVSLVENIDDEFNNIGKASEDLTRKIRELTSILRSMGIDNSSIATYVANTKAATAASNDAEIGLRKLKSKVDELVDTVESRAIPSTQDWASALIQLGTSASQISLAVNALNNLFNIFEDDNLDGIEGLTRLLTSIGIIIPIVTNAAKTLRGAAASTAATGAAAAGATGAVTGLGAAFSSALPVIGAVATVASLVLVAVAHFVPTAEKAEKSITKLTEAYLEATSELESLLSELETTQQKIEELNSKDKLELVDRNQLTRLKEQERYLQRLIELLEKSAKIALKNQADEILSNYSSIYQELILGSGYDIMSQSDFYESIGGQENEEAYYRYLDTVMENREEWAKNFTDDLLNFLELYNAIVDAILNGVLVDPEELEDLLTGLRQARLNIFTEDEYALMYVEPVLLSDAAELIKELLYDAVLSGTDISNILTDDLKQELLAAGITITDFSNFLNDRIKDTSDYIKETYDVADSELQKLTAKDWDVIATLNFEHIDDADDLWQLLEEHKNNVVNIDILIPNYDDVHEIIDDLNFGDIISKENYEKLGDAASGYFTKLLGDEKYQLTSDAKDLYDAIENLQLESFKRLRDQYAEQIKEMRVYNDQLLDNQLFKDEEGNNKYYGNMVYAQLEILEATGQYTELVAKWREDINDGHIEDILMLQDIATAMATVQSQTAELAGEYYELDLAIAKSYKTTEELREAYKNNEIGAAAYTKAMLDLETAARLDGLETDEIEDFADYLQEIADDGLAKVDDGLKDNEDAAKDLSILIQRMNKGVEDLADNWEEWSDILNNSSKDSHEYYEALESTKDAMSDLFDINRDFISEDLITSQMNDISLAAEGDADAIDRLRGAALKDIVMNLDLEDDALQGDELFSKVLSLQEKLDEIGPLEAGAVIDGDIEGGDEFLQTLNDMVRESGMTADLINAVLGAMGFSTTFAEEPQQVTTTIPEYTTYHEVVDDPSFTRVLNEGTPYERKVLGWAETSWTEETGSHTITTDAPSYAMQTSELGTTVVPKIESLTLKGKGSFNNFSSGNKGGGRSKKSSGGGGGSSQPKKEDRLERKTPKDVDDRYHEINRTIQEQDELLQDISEDIDLAYGTDRLKLFQKQIEELNKQADNYRGKMDLAAHFKDIDKNSLKEVLGLTDEDFDPITGEVLKYQDVLNGILDDYNAFGDKYNAFIDKYNGMTAELQEAALDQLDALKEEQALEEDNFNQKLDALGLYEDSLDEWRKAQNEFEEAMRAIEEAKLNEITHKVDVIIEIKNAEDAVRDFTKLITESFSDSLYNQLIGIGGERGRGTAQLGYEQAQAELELFKSYQEEYDSLRKRLNEANQYTGMEDLKEEFLELESNIISSGEALLDWIDSIEHMLPDAIDAARERFDQFTNLLSHNLTMLDTIEELYTLQGQTYKTQQGFNRLQSVAQERVDAAVANATLNRQWSQRAKKDLDAAQQALDDLMAEYAGQVTAENPMPWESDVRYDTLKANRDALLQEFNDSQEAMYQSAQEAMQAAQDMYLQQIEKAVYDFGQTLSDNVGLDLLQNKYDHYIESEGRYFDKVNEAYNVAAWYNKLQKAIDDSQNSTLTKNLQALQQEIDARREGGKLSEYDLEILEAKYKVLEAQAALEDAQNNKNELRLTHDRQGNWNYQYNANPDEVADKQQELLDAENEWYNLAKQLVEDVTGEIVDTWNECSEQIKDIYSDMTLTDEERAARAEEIYAYYAEKVKYLEEEKQNAIKDMTEAGNKSLFDMAVVAGDEVTDLTGITAQEIQDLVDESGKSLLELLLSNNDLIKDIVGSNSKLVDDFDNVFARDLSDMTKNAANFEDELRKTLDRAQGHFDDYENKIADVADNTGTDLYEMDRKVLALSDSTDECRDVGDKLVGTLWNMLDPVYDLTVEYSNLARSIMDTVNAMQQLAGRSTNAARTASGDTFFNDLDYSTLQAAALASGDEEAYNYLQRIREAKIKDQSLSEDYYVTNESTGDHRARIEALAEKGWSTATWGDYTDWRDIVEELKRRGFATGGYTGTFDDAKLAFLHEKELVLNLDDTENILAAVSTIRALSPDLLRSIEGTLDSSAVAGASLMGLRLGGMTFVPTADSLQQTVYINADFSGVSDRNEIVEAMNELVNMAAQRARRRTS